jgi:hypothetical protein
MGQYGCTKEDWEAYIEAMGDAPHGEMDPVKNPGVRLH